MCLTFQQHLINIAKLLKKSFDCFFSWLYPEACLIPKTCHSLQSVTSRRRYGAVNMVRSHIKFDKIQSFWSDPSILQFNTVQRQWSEN